MKKHFLRSSRNSLMPYPAFRGMREFTVVKRERRGQGLTSGAGENRSQEMLTFGQLDLEALHLRHEGGEARERLLAAASHADEQRVAARLA